MYDLINVNTSAISVCELRDNIGTSKKKIVGFSSRLKTIVDQIWEFVNKYIKNYSS